MFHINAVWMITRPYYCRSPLQIRMLVIQQFS